MSKLVGILVIIYMIICWQSCLVCFDYFNCTCSYTWLWILSPYLVLTCVLGWVFTLQLSAVVCLGTCIVTCTMLVVRVYYLLALVSHFRNGIYQKLLMTSNWSVYSQYPDQTKSHQPWSFILGCQCVLNYINMRGSHSLHLMDFVLVCDI